MALERQFTATAFIFLNEKVLLIFHKKLQKWLPPGGHLEPGELPHEGAIREAKEETGIDIELIPQENLWIDPKWNGGSFPRPYMCLLEEIPAFRDTAAHQHIDFIYLARPIGGNLLHNREETEGSQWFSLNEVEALKNDEEIFEESKMLIRHILNSSTIKVASHNQI